MKLRHCLTVIAAGLSLSACSSAPRTVSAFLPPPLACSLPCQAIPAPTATDNLGRMVWELEVIEVAGQCHWLHDDCVSATQQRAQQNAD